MFNPRDIKLWLRSPLVIVGELVMLALLCTLGAALPQVGSATSAELARLHEAGPIVAALVKWLALDHIFRSLGFLVVTALLSASLFVIIIEQLKRLRFQWSQRLTPAHFQSAAFRTEFERPAAGPASGVSPASTNSQIRVWTERRFGLLGSPVFHIGVLLVIVAGALKALFGTGAVVDLVEGETLPPTASAWAAQFPGLLGRPFQLDRSLTLKAVDVAHYKDGDLRDLKVRLSLPGQQGSENAEIAVNHDLKLGGGRLFLGSDFGPAALVEWQSAGAAPTREAALLTDKGKGDFEGASSGPNGLRAHLRAHVGPEGAPPKLVEVRVMKDGALLFTGDARVGQTVTLHSGEKLVLHGTPFWARLRGSRDAALWLAYAGFAFVMVGAVMIFGVVKLDWCVSVTSLGESERVFVALKPQRFAPLFQERFEQMLCELSENGTNRRGAKDAAKKPETANSASFAPLRFSRNDTPAGRLAGWLLFLCLTLSFTGCQRASFDEARKLVERYNQIVSEAYRRGDIKVVDPVVGPNEGKKLTGLIGVRLDLGLTLDSQLLSLEISGVEKSKDEMRVQTKERWSYRDRKIGTGEQVGEASQDSYEMLYVFKRIDKAWLVDEIKFTTPPQVGRKQTPWVADRKQLHSTEDAKK